MKKQSPDNRTLCICLTPLHVLIASRVSETNKHEFDLGVYISYQRDKKHEKYFDRMSSFCKRIEFIQPPHETYPRGIQKYITIFKRRRRFLELFSTFGKFYYVLTSCSINHYLWCSVQASMSGRLETYDDGLLNIATTPAEHYKKTTFLEKVFLKLSGLVIYKDKMIQLTSKHYSIYNEKNWYPRKHYIPLYENQNSTEIHLKNRDHREIFIGPAPEAPEAIWQMIEIYLREHPGTLYLNHPRTQQAKFEHSEILNTNLIIEDYVIQEIQNPGSFFTITGTESSALVNLSNLDKVKTQTILPNSPEFQEPRQLMKKHGVSLIYTD